MPYVTLTGDEPSLGAHAGETLMVDDNVAQELVDKGRAELATQGARDAVQAKGEAIHAKIDEGKAGAKAGAQAKVDEAKQKVEDAKGATDEAET